MPNKSIALCWTLSAGVVNGVLSVQNHLGDGDEGIALLKQRLDDAGKCLGGVECGVMEQDNRSGLDPGRDPLCNFVGGDIFPVQTVNVPLDRVVVGGGPAGMEAASTLACRGFQVTLFEQAEQLGGALNLADKPPKKQLVTRLKDVMACNLEELGVEVRLNTKATPEMVRDLEPDAVFLALGADPIVPQIPCSGPVYTFTDILTESVVPKGRAAVIGGGLVGLETAEFLAEKGYPVTVVEMQDAVGKGVYATVVLTLTKGLSEHNATILTNHQLTAVTETGIETLVLPPSVIVGKQTALCVGGSRGYLAQAE